MLCNGCGPQRLWLLPIAWLRIPQFVFTPAGNEHDWDYHVGGGVGAYCRANLRFYANCLRCIADHSPLWKWPLHWLAAHVYYGLVKIGGGLAFHWGRPRTMNEMIALALELEDGK